ncbi:14767_t:CDS:2, partial [Racocetra fulgida]
ALLADLLPKQEPKIEAPEKPVEKEPTLPPDSIKIDNLPPNFITSSGPATPTITTRFVPDFTTFEAVILDIPPKEIVHYNKEVQTAATSFEEPPPSEEEIREKVRLEFEEQLKAKEAAAAELRARQEAEKNKELKLLDAERKNIIASPEFKEFVEHSAKMVERSDVLTTMFSEFHPSYIIGGTYSGQILVWDMRAKCLPVLKTPLSTAGHTHPVYSMQMVGTQNAHNLITASTDGMETLELVHSGHNKTDEVSVTSFGFPENETSTFWVGTEEGNLYQANRFGHAGGKAGINQYDTYKGHWGPVTGLHFHPLVGPVDFSDLFLTSSVDWTVKLWKAKSIAKPSATTQTISPLYSFEGTDDYIYDVKWSPTNPALFGSVDGKGNFAVWNINDDTEIPAVNTQVGNRALNKLQWDKEGRRAAIGSSDGRVHVYDIGE